MAMYQRDPRAGAFLGGERISGQEIRDQNGKFFDKVCSLSRGGNLTCLQWWQRNLLQTS